MLYIISFPLDPGVSNDVEVDEAVTPLAMLNILVDNVFVCGYSLS